MRKLQVSASPSWLLGFQQAALRQGRRDSGAAAAAPRSPPAALPAVPPALPAGWSSSVSQSTGDTYYVNDHTGESTYELPTAPAEPRAEAIE